MADEEPQESEKHEEEDQATGLLYLLHRNESSFRFAQDMPGIVLVGLLDSLEKREQSAKVERVAALTIQSSARRMMCGIVHGTDRKAAITLERLYRGHLGRLAFEVKQEERDAQTRRAFWDCNATLVQKLWRGFHSRKHAHNFYLRKAYLTSVMTRGLEVRSELEAHYRSMSELEESKMEHEKIERFENVIGSLHHMLSTASCSGVYNSPYNLVNLPGGLRVSDCLAVKPANGVRVADRVSPEKRGEGALPPPCRAVTSCRELCEKQSCGWVAARLCLGRGRRLD
uniref:Uncharacterized protein n=1 Tax=Guillardia theta TaxID=55529 RepID=A0A7S4PM33_GUITH|mmetsp:Transcript_6159/g.21774  ORF Transcript_6159/g.21774 Transcript_6159/m.21774 type:complete len:285 (+) Transcript_6159:267-1121(+)